jgi:crossover junction endodeoxyribonuclease RuvC
MPVAMKAASWFGVIVAIVIVLGVDPGSRRCGYGAVDRDGSRFRVVDSGVLIPGELPIAERLASILTGLVQVIARVGAEEVAVEAAFAGRSIQSALVLGHARGVVLAVSAGAGLPVFEYAPSQVKLAVAGNGRADKAQMVKMAQVLLRVRTEIADEADALAVAVCHHAHRQAQAKSGNLQPRMGNPRLKKVANR